MKLFFCGLAAVLTVTALSGCGTSSENGGRDSLTQRMETNADSPSSPGLYTMPGAGAPSVPQSNPRANMLQNPPTGMQRNYSADMQQAGAIRTVAEDVRLENENIGGMTEAELLSKLTETAARTNTAPVDASFDKRTWAVRKEKAGKRLDIDRVVQDAMNAGKGERIRYNYVTVNPRVGSAQLKSKVKRIAKYTTPLLDRSRSRIKNIRLASSKLDRKIILPGQEFSFNKATGSKSKALGYEDATVIVRTPDGPEHKKAPGGGVCQISTTLYNAVLQCGLKITERHEHSDEVYYVPDGKDATVTYRGQDLKFINNRSYPVMIRVIVRRNSLQVSIYENRGLA